MADEDSDIVRSLEIPGSSAAPYTLNRLGRGAAYHVAVDFGRGSAILGLHRSFRKIGRTDVCMYVFVYVRMYLCTYVHVYTRMYVCTCVCVQ